MFYIIKKGTGNFWHRFNNDSKEVNISKWEVVLDNVNQTVSLQMPNGSNIPANEVGILEVIVIDETGANVNETFSNVLSLRVRLVTLGYNPYDSSGGGGGATTFLGLSDVPSSYSGEGGKIVKVKATEDGLEFVTESVNVPTLQEVLDKNNETSTSAYFNGGNLIIDIGNGSYISFVDGIGYELGTLSLNNGNLTFYDNVTGFSFKTKSSKLVGGDKIFAVDAVSITSDTIADNDMCYVANGTILFTDPTAETNKGYVVHVIGGTSTIGGVGYTTGALVYRFYDGTSWSSKDYGDIPAPITIDATPTNGSPNAVSSGGTATALATKVDKNTAITGATKTKITYDSKGLVTAGADLVASDLPTGIDASKINTGVVSNTEFNYLDGVNAPIQSQLDLRKKQVYSTGTSVTHTGTLLETTLLRITIPAGTLTTTDWLNINRIVIARGLGQISSVEIKLKLSTSATLPSGTTDQIGICTFSNTQRSNIMSRGLWQESGSINFFNPTTTTLTDIISINGAFGSAAFNNTSTTYYLYISATLITGTDNVTLRAVDITN